MRRCMFAGSGFILRIAARKGVNPQNHASRQLVLR